MSTVSRRQKPSWTGFTLVELLVVIAIIAMLAALLFPVGSRMLRQAQGAVCANNLRRTGELIFVYAGDNDGYFPWLIQNGNRCFNRGSTFGTLAGYDGMSDSDFTAARAKTIWNCPAQTASGTNCYYDYAGNVHVMGFQGQGSTPTYQVLKLSAVKKPSATILMADNASDETNGMNRIYISKSTGQWPWTIGIGARHNGKANVLFCDGHVASLYTKDDTNSPRNPADLITDDKLLP
ncbi:MAG: prepilin-type N-terminal cleavage/methylation domain-containing protein [Terrimicrobiaceae bacterium]